MCHGPRRRTTHGFYSRHHQASPLFVSRKDAKPQRHSARIFGAKRLFEFGWRLRRRKMHFAALRLCGKQTAPMANDEVVGGDLRRTTAPLRRCIPAQKDALFNVLVKW
jgi:hypothetical protein